MSRLVFALLLVTSLAACQSEQAAMRVVCDAPLDCTECGQGAPDSRQTRLAQHISERLSNAKVRDMFDALAVADPASRQSLLNERAKAVGLDRCALADAMAPVQIEASEQGSEPTSP